MLKSSLLTWKYRNLVQHTRVICVTSSWPRLFLSLISPIHTDTSVSFPRTPPCEQKILLPLALGGVSSFQFTLTFSEPVSEHPYKRFYLRNGSSIFWGRVDGFYCLPPGTRKTSKRMWVLWLLGGNLIWQVVVQEGSWARGDCSAHTHCSSRGLQLADLCISLIPSVSLFKHLMYYFSLLEYSLLSCHSYSSPASIFLVNIAHLKIIHTRKIDRYLTYNTVFDTRGLFQNVPTENHFNSVICLTIFHSSVIDWKNTDTQKHYAKIILIKYGWGSFSWVSSLKLQRYREMLWSMKHRDSDCNYMTTSEVLRVCYMDAYLVLLLFSDFSISISSKYLEK